MRSPRRARSRSTPRTGRRSASGRCPAPRARWCRSAAKRRGSRPGSSHGRTLPGNYPSLNNALIADRLDAFASLLELSDANPYTVRAYRRAAETIRGAAVPVADLVRSGRVRDLRGIGPGIEARLRELVATGRIAELEELERELAPDLVGLGRYLGLTARKSIEIARAVEIRTADKLREAAAAGRLRSVPGVGPKTKERLLDALAREHEPRPRKGLLLNRALQLVDGIADVLGGEAAGDVRRWRDSCEYLAVVVAATDPRPALERFAGLPQIVALVEQQERRALGVTVEGVPVELVVAEPAAFGTVLVRATGSAEYVDALAAAGRPRRGQRLRGARRSVVPARAARASVSRRAAGARRAHGHPRGPPLPHHWSDGRVSVEEMGHVDPSRRVPNVRGVPVGDLTDALD